MANVSLEYYKLFSFRTNSKIAAELNVIVGSAIISKVESIYFLYLTCEIYEILKMKR